MASLDVKIEVRVNVDPERLKQALIKEMYAFENDLLAASAQRVPVDLGTLMSSGNAEVPTEDGGVITGRVGYGGPASGYALFVHEALEGPHAISLNWSWAKAAAKGKPIHWTRPGSGPKYLTGPLQEMQDQLPDRLGQAVQDALK